MEKKLLKKGIVVAIIVLFVVASVLPSMSGANNVKKIDASVAFILPHDAQSTTGPIPPSDCDMGFTGTTKSQVVISDVPAYKWKHGCGPTAAGMIIGYWDGQDFDNLIAGDASTQTNAVNDTIATEGDGSGTTSNPGTPGTGHVPDYAFYDGVDDRGDPDPYPDMSEIDPSGAHDADSIADFMETSWSSENNYYGWSWFSDVDDAITGYVNWATSYTVITTNVLWASLTWEDFKAEIDADRPVVLLVDSSGDGNSDHFVTAIGYDDTANQYGIYNTWDTEIHWYDFRPMSSSYSWGIYGATFIRFVEVEYAPVWEIGDKWIFSMDPIEIDIEGNFNLNINLDIGDLNLEVVNVNSDSYEVYFNAKVNGGFTLSNSDHSFEISGVFVNTIFTETGIEGKIIFQKSNLEIKDIDIKLYAKIKLKLFQMLPPIRVPIDIELNIDYDTPLTPLDFPLYLGKVWTNVPNTMTVDGQISSVWFRFLKILNKVLNLLPPEIANLLPVIDISDLFDVIGVDNTFEIPGDNNAYECVSWEEINVPAGTFYAYKISIGDKGFLYYAPDVGFLPKLSVDISEYNPFIDNINLELLDTNYT